ncbi:GNAT family N-acetyltransferase [Microbacterium sp. CBA3102]|uniref:GNAT family N-acetyltransferase n=1 Tax=Microbacterium sp. CBA3102 TaxID=2603598 RepID=UPI0011BB834A|nr:GNAT family N-acetyltransferase [Microbacterium sp. CBA3102]
MFRLRRRTPSDCEAVVSWVPDSDALYLFTGPRLRWPLDTVQLSEMEDEGHSGWTLVEDESDEALGHFDLAIDGEAARLGRVCIDPMRRGQGLAHVLVGCAIDRARSLGASEMRLNVIVGNDAAIRTYERAGFTTSPRSDRPDVLVMSRVL